MTASCFDTVEGEGITFNQWHRQPKYIRDIICGLVRERDQAVRKYEQVALQKAPSPIAQHLDMGRGEEWVYLRDAAVTLMDHNGEHCARLTWDNHERVLEVMSTGRHTSPLLIQPRVSNVVTIHVDQDVY